jgi:hypothetical protein
MGDRELSTSDLAEKTEASAPDDRADAEQPEAAADAGDREAPAGEDGAERAAIDSAEDQHGPLLPNDEGEGFTTRWRDIQTGFVDEPRDSVAQADALVAELMQRLAAGFSEERQQLEAQWDRGDEVSTEDLRVALTRYRSFFERLLSA